MFTRQRDGNLRLYGEVDNVEGKCAMWASNTGNAAADYSTVMLELEVQWD